MGGYGSGRNGWRVTVGACHVVDVNELHRTARRQIGQTHQWQANQVSISYRVCGPSGRWEDVTLPVQIVNIPCRFGGTRPYFICPGMPYRAACSHRVVKLYCHDGLYLCRRCHHLAYASENEDEMSRVQRRARKIRRRVGGSPDWGAPFPQRPKGMWQRTYERMRRRHLEAERRIDDAFDVGAAAVLRHMR